MRSSDTLVNIILIGAVVSGVLILLLLDAIQGFFNKGKAKDRVQNMNNEAQLFFTSLAQSGRLPAATVDIVLKSGEIGLFQEPSVLYESRAYRVFGGAGTRVAGIYIGGGASESQQRLKEIDSGTIVLTNQRLVFDGQTQNRVLNLKDVISATPWLDAIEVGCSRRQKSQVYKVKNPLIWAPLIKMLGGGDFPVSASNTGSGTDRSDILAGGAKVCPGCREKLMTEAVRCRFCGYDFRAKEEGTPKRFVRRL